MSDPTLSQWTGQIGTTAFGRSSDYPGIGGSLGLIGTPPVPGHDLTFGLKHGAAGGTDRYTQRAIKIPFVITQTTDALFAAKVATLKTAWQPVDADVPLYIRLGGPQRVYFGRPRGLDDSSLTYRPAFGDGKLFGQFVCLDPFAYDAASSIVEQTSSPFGLNNLGDVRSLRCTLTVRGNGGTPVITNTTDPDAGDITFNQTLAASATAEIDLYQQTALVGVTSIVDKIAISSLWFDLLPGNNVITFTGCAGIAVTWRGAYQ
jgi:hypothetical protein